MAVAAIATFLIVKKMPQFGPCSYELDDIYRSSK